MNDVSAFFGAGYKEKKKSVVVIKNPEPESVWPVIEASDDAEVAVNVMGKLYEGKDEIQLTQGNIIVDGIKAGELPITSGTWFKILKGEQKSKNSILTICKSCDTMEGV